MIELFVFVFFLYSLYRYSKNMGNELWQVVSVSARQQMSVFTKPGWFSSYIPCNWSAYGASLAGDFCSMSHPPPCSSCLSVSILLAVQLVQQQKKSLKTKKNETERKKTNLRWSLFQPHLDVFLSECTSFDWSLLHWAHQGHDLFRPHPQLQLLLQRQAHGRSLWDDARVCPRWRWTGCLRHQHHKPNVSRKDDFCID